jgi:ABC-type transport system involved in cytochrome bd biosynthesis fused ATPase/permease subunit
MSQPYPHPRGVSSVFITVPELSPLNIFVFISVFQVTHSLLRISHENVSRKTASHQKRQIYELDYFLTLSKLHFSYEHKRKGASVLHNLSLEDGFVCFQNFHELSELSGVIGVVF